MRYGYSQRRQCWCLLSYGPSEGLRPPQDDKRFFGADGMDFSWLSSFSRLSDFGVQILEMADACPSRGAVK